MTALGQTQCLQGIAKNSVVKQKCRMANILPESLTTVCLHVLFVFSATFLYLFLVTEVNLLWSISFLPGTPRLSLNLWAQFLSKVQLWLYWLTSTKCSQPSRNSEKKEVKWLVWMLFCKGSGTLHVVRHHNTTKPKSCPHKAEPSADL